MSGDTTHELNRRSFLKATGAAGAALAFGGVAAATPGRTPGPKENEVLVGVSASAPDLRAAVEPHLPSEATVVHDNEVIRYVAVAFPASADAARSRFMDAVTDADHVKYAEPNTTHHAFLTPNDPKFSSQYAPQMVNADSAWDTTLGSGGVTISVIDEGVQYDHPDLTANMSDAVSNHGKDFVDNDSDPYPVDLSSEYHATHVSGIAAGSTDNGTGIAGISESSILSARALDAQGSGSTSDIADAIQWSADQGVDVINMSLGGGGYTSTMKNAVSYASNNGVFIAAAAGNSSSSSVSYPAGYSECLAVSALDADGSFASYSNYGSDVELCAPGTNVLSTTTTDRGSYEKLSGTSMATPVVSGVAGLALAQWSLSNTELRSHLTNTAVDVGLPSSEQGSGRVDAYNAVTTQPTQSTSTSSTVDGSLGSSYDSDCWSYGWNYASPSQVEVDLSGPSDADFDLYVDDGTGTCPTTTSYDYRSYSTDSQESIVVDTPDTSTDLTILVDSYSGSGSYTLTVTETK